MQIRAESGNLISLVFLRLPFFTQRDDWASLQATLAERRRNSAGDRNRLLSVGLSQENLLDMAASSLEINASSAPDLPYRIASISSIGTLPVIYVVQNQGKYKILGTSDSPDQIGERVLQLLARQDTKAAQAWLDLVVPDLQDVSSSRSLLPAARLLWSGVVESTRGPSAINTAAASLIGPFNGSPKAIQILTESRARASVSIERGQIDLALCQSFEKAKR